MFILYDVVVYYSAYVLLQESTRLHFQIIDHVSAYGLLVWKEAYGQRRVDGGGAGGVGESQTRGGYGERRNSMGKSF